MTQPPSFSSREEAREWKRQQMARHTDSVLALALRAVARDVLTMINEYGGAFLPVVAQSTWDDMESIAGQAMERFDRVPDSPNDLLIEELASATWAVIHKNWASHEAELTQWPLVYGRLLAADVAVTDSVARALPYTVADPLADHVAVEGGYRWFSDGRSPEPVETS